MSSFMTPLRIERLDRSEDETGRGWVVCESFEYRIGSLDSTEYVVVPAGTRTDFASIPRLFWSIWPPVGGPYDKAAVLHDELYFKPIIRTNLSGGFRMVNRGQADDIFLEAMGVLEVSGPTKFAIHRGVRIGGWKAWRKYRSAEVLSRTSGVTVDTKDN